MNTYPNVFKYGAKARSGDQRWAFRFSLNDPLPQERRGRPRAIAVAFCARWSIEESGQWNTNYFYTEKDAAFACDCWKHFLMRTKGAVGLKYSLGSLENFAVEFERRFKIPLTDLGGSILPGAALRELHEFLVDNEEALQRIEGVAPSRAWDPDDMLAAAKAGLVNCPEGKGIERTLILAWAHRYRAHVRLMRDVQAYGEKKLLARAEVRESGLRNLLQYSKRWYPAAKGTHYKVLEILERLEAWEAKQERALQEIETIRRDTKTFLDTLAQGLDALKQERIDISTGKHPKLQCETSTGQNPNGSASGGV